MRRSRWVPLLFSALVLTVLGGLLLSRAPRSRFGAFEPKTRELAALGLVRAGAVASSPAPAQAAALDPPGAPGYAPLRLIRTASVALEVGRYAEAARGAEAIAVAHGGYLADARVSREAGDRERGTLTLRIPADRFDEALRGLEGLGKVESADVETQDVSKEYFDLETRLATKRATEGRLREILQTRTARLADVLAAEKELSRVTEERELLEGQRKFYDRQLAMSTFTVELHEPAALLREGALAPLREALGRALPLLSASAAALLYAIAAALPWGLVGLGIWRLRRRLVSRARMRVVTEA